MNILEIISKKKDGLELSREELEYAFMGYMNNAVPDYQMSSLLMAITIKGMSFEETANLTNIMLKSGHEMDTSSVKGMQVDKHSTGGVGDKTSMIIGPILASLGLKMGKLSGRGLGFTGGTVDKLESIPGFRVALTEEEFIHDLNKVGFVECEQTPEFTPLDKVIYNLRSITGTVESIPLIASSIMSKKLAVGAKYILIDLKVGEGALIKNKHDAVDLANMMIEIGKRYHTEVIPVLTDMNNPLGDNVGNVLEVLEALDVLKGKYGMLRDLCIELSSVLYSKAMNVDMNKAKELVTDSLDTGKAYNKFLEFIKMQGGDIEKIEVAQYLKPVASTEEGKLKNISAYKIGMLSLHLGGGRDKKGALINYGVGVVMNKHIGDTIKVGDTLCYLYQKDETDYSKEALDAFTIVK